MRRSLVAPIVALALAAPVLAGCSAIEDTVAGEDTSSLNCATLAEEAVRISEEQEALVQLLKVRAPEVVTDNLDSYTVPTGTEEVLVLKCEGMGVWSDGSNSGVVLKATVDSDGDTWIKYAPTAN